MLDCVSVLNVAVAKELYFVVMDKLILLLWGFALGFTMDGIFDFMVPQ